MQAQSKIAVAGATGRLGRHVVDVLQERGHQVVPMSRSTGVDLITRDGLEEALQGVDCVIDSATQPTNDMQAATDFFTASARNLHEVGERAGVAQIVVVSIIGCDRFSGGFLAGKAAHERAVSSGAIPVRLLRAAQFHEFLSQMVDWGTQGDVARVPEMRTQIVAARSVAEALADMAATAAPEADGPIPEIAGPREESLVELATLFASSRRDGLRVEGVSDPADPDRELYEADGLLPGPHATLAGPTFEEWLEAGADA